jgi:uncharacterized membrane protein
MMPQQTLVQKILPLSTKCWLISLMLAQAVFVTYLCLGYGLASLKGKPQAWNTFNNTAFVANDTAGNLFYGLHVLLAIIMIAGGSFQLIPAIRNKFIKFHRMNGRIYVSLACVISLAGMYLILFRGTVGNVFLHSMTFFSGIVVVLSSFLAIRAIRRKEISIHQRWATRLFLAANGVLFFRLFIFAWFLVFGSLGVNTDDFTGPTVYAVSLCSYLLPLIFFEWYRWAVKQQSKVHHLAVGVILMGISAIFLIGLFGITMANWYPSIVRGFG